uniref:Uncharacterized protein n=1 Tax=Meloidogyne enterolobii TaxID=390850 RepID=A0A6V7Y1E8_MELEN|nr:unnamed protein product [Meloidogyne enterolobii]
MIAVSEICLRKILIKLKMPREKRKRNNLLKSLIFIKLILINSIFGISDGAIKLNIMCKDLFTCTVKNRCVQLDSLQSSFENATIGKNLYNELDKNIDYGCIFTSGCMEECNKCPLCMTSKQQVCSSKYQGYPAVLIPENLSVESLIYTYIYKYVVFQIQRDIYSKHLKKL